MLIWSEVGLDLTPLTLGKDIIGLVLAGLREETLCGMDERISIFSTASDLPDIVTVMKLSSSNCICFKGPLVQTIFYECLCTSIQV